MKTQKAVYLLTFLAGSAFSSFAQNDSFSEAEMEIKSERNMYTKVFLNSNGEKQAIISAGPVHYKQNDTWEEINTTLLSNQNGFYNETNAIRSYFPKYIDGSAQIKYAINASDEILIGGEKKLVLFDPVASELNEISTNPSSANPGITTIMYPEIYPGISDEFSILKGHIKNNLILHTIPDLLTNISSGYFGFQETLELPAGWKIVASDPTVRSFTSSSLFVINSNGEQVLTIPAPVFFDHDGFGSDGGNIVEGKYLFNHENNTWKLNTLVPVDWLKDPNRQYPVSIDPTVIVAGTTGGWQSPNNWVDNSSFVFIGVCCGNLTHRAWIKFNTTAIPDGTCIQTTELQVNVYTEANATAELTLINDVTGAFGPYGGIVPAAYNDFGNGFYTSFTITGTGLYGYYVLGANANAVLQSQLPVNWFQPALQFNNEPSTNYKNIDALASNLRVTYPCALPVELLSFDAKCNNDRVNLTWTTASEINNKYFSIGKSSDGINYEVIGTVIGSGNSNQSRNYSFVDPQASEGTTYYYLKQTDYDGTVEYLDLATINCTNEPGFNIYPNPGAGIFMIEGTAIDDIIIVTDVLGNILYQARVNSEKTEINLSQHQSGTYFVQRISNGGAVSKKLIIQ